MRSDFYKEKLHGLPDEELLGIIDDSANFNKAYREQAKKELDSRKRDEQYADEAEELAEIRKQGEEERKKQEKELLKEKKSKFDKNAVKDEKAPELFSQIAIYNFSIFFSIIFGAVFFAMNLKKFDRDDKILPVMLIAAAIHVASVYLVYELSFGFRYALAIILHAAGSNLLIRFFWDRYVGKTLHYRKRKILLPLAIVFAVSFLITYFSPMNYIIPDFKFLYTIAGYLIDTILVIIGIR